jgi:hypothetical protein
MSTIDELVPLSETLNAESNDLNKTIAKVSDKLAALNLGIEVWFSTVWPDADCGEPRPPAFPSTKT